MDPRFCVQVLSLLLKRLEAYGSYGSNSLSPFSSTPALSSLTDRLFILPLILLCFAEIRSLLFHVFSTLDGDASALFLTGSAISN